MKKQKIQLNYNQNQDTEQNKQYKNKDKIIKDKNQLNDNENNVDRLSTSVLDLLKVFYNTRSGNKILKHCTHNKSNNIKVTSK